jgi:hypothetical protein
VIAGFDVTARDGKGHEARIAKEIPMFKKIIEECRDSQALGGGRFRPGPRPQL